MEDLLTRLRNRIVALVALILFLASAPVITLIVAITCALDTHPDPSYAPALMLGGPVICAFWYMFVASITRAARVKLEFSPDRTGFLWALGRLIGGWFLSQAWVLAVAWLLAALLPVELGWKGPQDIPSYILYPSLSLAIWAPVIINLLRHFGRKPRLVREWRESQARSQEQRRYAERAKLAHQRELQKERDVTSAKNGDVARKFSNLVSVCGGPWGEFLKIKSALTRDDSPAVPFQTAVEYDLHSILKTVARANGEVTLDIADLWHAALSEFNPTEWHSIAECKKMIESEEDLRFQVPTAVTMLGVVDKIQKSSFANLAASAYNDFVLAATTNFKSSAAVEGVRQAYFEELKPYLSSGANRGFSEDSSNSDKRNACGFMEDCALLGVDEYYALDELNSARRTKAAQWHPDKLENMAPALKEYASQQLAHFNAAYDRLKDRVQWNIEPKTLAAEGQEVAAIAKQFSREMAQLRDAVKSGVSVDATEIDRMVAMYGDGIRKMKAYLSRVRQEAPMIDVRDMEQSISDAIEVCRMLKGIASNAASAGGRR